MAGTLLILVSSLAGAAVGSLVIFIANNKKLNQSTQILSGKIDQVSSNLDNSITKISKLRQDKQLHNQNQKNTVVGGGASGENLKAMIKQVKIIDTKIASAFSGRSDNKPSSSYEYQSAVYVPQNSESEYNENGCIHINDFGSTPVQPQPQAYIQPEPNAYEMPEQPPHSEIPEPEANTLKQVEPITISVSDMFEKVKELRNGNPQYRLYNVSTKRMEFSSSPNAPYIYTSKGYILPNQIDNFKKLSISEEIYKCSENFIFDNFRIKLCTSDSSGNILSTGEIFN